MWLKGWHIIAMVTWFAAMFYLPRLFVYHAMTEDQPGIDRFKVMERKLFYGIMQPAGIATMVLGLWMLWDYAWLAWGSFIWLHIKLLLVALLVGYHLWCWKLVKDFAADRNNRSHVWFRFFNEVPVLFLIAIVLLASVKPFGAIS